jgi:hypothetical protein
MKPVSGQEAELSDRGKLIAGLVTYSWFNSLACHWFNSPNCPPGSADHRWPLASAEIAEVPHHTNTPCLGFLFEDRSRKNLKFDIIVCWLIFYCFKIKKGVGAATDFQTTSTNNACPLALRVLLLLHNQVLSALKIYSFLKYRHAAISTAAIS